MYLTFGIISSEAIISKKISLKYKVLVAMIDINIQLKYPIEIISIFLICIYRNAEGMKILNLKLKLCVTKNGLESTKMISSKK